MGDPEWPETYNSPELRSSLMARGHVFQTSHSDTECLLIFMKILVWICPAI